MRSLLTLRMCSYWLRTWRPHMYTPFAYAFAYVIKQTPYAFVAKIILCMYLLYDVVEPESSPQSGVTMLNNIVDNIEQCGQHNTVKSCFQQPSPTRDFLPCTSNKCNPSCKNVWPSGQYGTTQPIPSTFWL